MHFKVDIKPPLAAHVERDVSKVDPPLTMASPESCRVVEAQPLWYLPPRVSAISRRRLSRCRFNLDLHPAIRTGKRCLVGPCPPDVWRTQDSRPGGAGMGGGAVLHGIRARLSIVPAELAQPVPAWSVSKSGTEESVAVAVRTGRGDECSSSELIHLGPPSSFRPGFHVSPEPRERHNRPAFHLRGARAFSYSTS